MIQIICNRCNKPIESIDKVGFIQFCYHNPFESVTDNNISDRNHYCEGCMDEIEQFISGRVDVNIDLQIDGQMMPKIMAEVRKETARRMEIESQSINTPLLREKDFKSEPRSDRHRIDYERIMSLKESGMKNKDIAAEMGMTPQEVSTAVYTYKKRKSKALESERKGSDQKKTEKSKQKKSEEPKKAKWVDTGKILALWNAKWSIGKIAEEMGMEESEVANILTR